MSRIAGIALICFVLCGICMPAYAEAYSIVENGAANRKMVISNGYSVTISEQVTIEPGRNVAFSVGVSTAAEQERRSAEIHLHYVPD